MTHDDQDWLRRSLSVLAPADAAWPSADDIRRRAAGRRRHQRTAGSVALAVVLALAVGTVSLLPSSPGAARLSVTGRSGAALQFAAYPAPRGLAGDQGAETAVATTEEGFSLALLRQLAASAPASANIVVSPSSLATALAMLELGARGATEQQIAQALGSAGLSAEQQAAGWAALSADLARAGTHDHISVQSADSLWLQQGLPMMPGFMTDLSRYFATGVWQVDFARDPSAAVRALNAWVSKATHGLIKSIFAPGVIDNSTALILANAVYFNAAWLEPFLEPTTAGPFRLDSGATVSVPFMHSGRENPISVNALVHGGLDAVQLPYAGGRFAALVLMPPAGTLPGFVKTLSRQRLDAITGGLGPASAILAMPRLRLRDYHDLKATLQALGMKLAFSAADLSGMSPAPLVVQDVAQRAFLKVTESGTEAAAATGIGVMESARLALNPVSITIDHPFLFLIRDTQTGAILFASQVENPAAS